MNSKEYDTALVEISNLFGEIGGKESARLLSLCTECDKYERDNPVAAETNTSINQWCDDE